MADTVELCSPGKGGKKRSRNPQEWKREKRKRLRIAGKEYVNTRGELVSGRKIGEDCKCRRNCYVNVSEEVRMKLFEGYYSLNSHDEQNAYLFGLIRKKDIARKRSKDSVRRTCTYTYYVRNRGKEIQVCRLAFAHIHGISSPKIRNLCLKLDMNVMFPHDGRGKHDHRPKKTTDDSMEQIRKHINSIIRTDRVKDFMKEEKINGPDVNITKMWKDYLSKYEPDIDVDAISSKAIKSQRKVENMDPESIGQHEAIPDIHQSRHPGIGSTHQLISQYGHGDNFINLGNGDADHPSNILSNINMDVRGNNTDRHIAQEMQAQQDGEHDSQTDDDSEGDTVQRTKPMVKHWLYSKVFHDELKFHDFLSLRKKLWDLKGDKINIAGMSSSSNTYALSCPPKSRLLNKTMFPKSERKQRTPKKIANAKEELERLSLQKGMTPDLIFHNSASSSTPTLSTSTVHGFHPPEMYILPVRDVEPQRLHQQSTLMAMDLVTSQQPHLAHHQRHVGTHICLHSFASVTAQHPNRTSTDGLGADGQQQSSGPLQYLASSTLPSVHLSQSSCNYMNINSPLFY